MLRGESMSSQKKARTPKSKSSSSQNDMKEMPRYIKTSAKKKPNKSTSAVRKKTNTESKSKRNGPQKKRKTNQLTPKKNGDSKRSTQAKQKKRRPASKNKLKKKRQKKKQHLLLKQLMLTIGISLVLFSTITYFTIRIPKMDGYSMTTTLTDKDRVFVSKLSTVKRFKLVYFKHPLTKEPLIRRIIGMPGDDLYYKNDELFINDKLTPERFLEKSVATAKQAGFLLTQDFSLTQVINENRIPPGKYFVLGDNRQYSSDSRYFGLIDEKDIIGVVEIRFFPFHTVTRF